MNSDADVIEESLQYMDHSELYKHATAQHKKLHACIEALERIKNHQKVVSGNMAELSATWHLANTALEATK